MEIKELRRLACLVVDCYQHDGWYEVNNKFHSEPRANIQDHARQALAYFDCPEEWQSLVMLCVEGADYYGFEDTVFGDGR
jgi:hypothetical protein